MPMTNTTPLLPLPLNNTRIGFHYYPDAEHYRDSDLHSWLPHLTELGATWLSLYAPIQRAIPEAFITGIRSSGIEPILHFHLPLAAPPPPSELSILFEAYAHWGVNYIVLFNRPNLRSSWTSRTWTQAYLVERFLDIFLPLAEMALQAGLYPVFPPLEPGGDYWDTAFLCASLEAIQRRGHATLLSKMILSAYARASNRPIDWGAGGPERWPQVRPYYTPKKSQDHLGFRIFDWYLTIIKSVLREPRPLILLGAGCCPGDHLDPHEPPITPLTHAEQNIAIARLMMGETMKNEPVPPEVLSCNYWLLAASPQKPYAFQAWYQPDGKTLPVVGALRQWIASSRSEIPKHPENNLRQLA
jgi:hypothetical protein